MAANATVVDADRAVRVQGDERGDTLIVDPVDLEHAIGWELRPEGLCRGDVCVPVRDHSALVVDGGIDLRAVASSLHRPFAFEPGPPVAVLGDAPEERTAATLARHAPDFTLPDLDREPVALSDFRGTKRLLLAWASW